MVFVYNKSIETEKEGEVAMTRCVTGVLYGSSVGEFWGEEYIVLDYEEAYEEAVEGAMNDIEKRWLRDGIITKETKREDIKEKLRFYAEEVIDTIGIDMDVCASIQLYGDWKKVDGKYAPDEEGEYSAIYDANDNIIQVAWSKWVIDCAPCSPCFPGQGDIDTRGELVAYMLPEDLMGEGWIEWNEGRIREYEVD